ncbi:MAG: hypothetical protein V7K48_16135, partial [Nostoc sp.]
AGGIAEAVTRIRSQIPYPLTIEVETETLEQVIVEIPPIELQVIKHRLHQLTCTAMRYEYSCKIARLRKPKWVRSKSCCNGSAVKWSVPQ